MQYASPMLLVTVVREMFNTILNQTDEKDVSTNCVIEQAIVKLSDKAYKLIHKLNKHITNYQIILTNEPICSSSFIRVSSAITLSGL